jgi:hypothetical protein
MPGGLHVPLGANRTYPVFAWRRRGIVAKITKPLRRAATLAQLEGTVMWILNQTEHKQSNKGLGAFGYPEPGAGCRL